MSFRYDDIPANLTREEVAMGLKLQEITDDVNADIQRMEGLCRSASLLQLPIIRDLAEMIENKYLGIAEPQSIELPEMPSDTPPELISAIRSLAVGEPLGGLKYAVDNVRSSLRWLEDEAPFDVKIIRAYIDFQETGSAELLSRTLFARNVSVDWRKSTLKAMRDEWAAWETGHWSQMRRHAKPCGRLFHQESDALLILCSGTKKESRLLSSAEEEVVAAALPLAEGLYRETSLLERDTSRVEVTNVVLELGRLTDALRQGRSEIERRDDDDVPQHDLREKIIENWNVRFLAVVDAVLRALLVTRVKFRWDNLLFDVYGNGRRRRSDSEFRELAFRVTMSPSNGSASATWTGILCGIAIRRLGAGSCSHPSASAAAGADPGFNMRIVWRCGLFACMHAVMCMHSEQLDNLLGSSPQS